MDEDPLFSTAFEAHILAALSSHLALLPCRDPKLDDNYPPTAVQPPGVTRYRSASDASSDISTASSGSTNQEHSIQCSLFFPVRQNLYRLESLISL